MAYDSELKDLNKVEIPDACTVNPVKNGDGDGCLDDNGLRALFDQVLSFFLKEVSVNKNAFRPFPPKLGDGQETDLFKLFLTVRRIGSYELVSETDMWEFVAKECGIEVGFVASLKLIYVKYLKELDEWLMKGGFRDEELENVETSVLEKLFRLSHQLDEHGCSLPNPVGNSFSDGDIIGAIDGNKGRSVGIESGGMPDENTNEGNEGGLNLDPTVNADDQELSAKDAKLSPEKVVKKVGFSMINDDNKRIELSPDNVVKKVGLSVINDDDKTPGTVVKEVEASMFIDDDEEFSIEDDRQISLSIKNVVNDVLRLHSDNDVTLNAKDDDRDNTNVEKVVRSKKRKSEKESFSLSEMLDWIATAARDPHHAAVQTSQGSSKSKNNTSNKLRKQALLARRALFAELNFGSGNEAGGSQKKNQRMHPGMYEDAKVQVHQASEGTRCSRRATSAKTCSCPSCVPLPLPLPRSSSRNKRQKTESGKTPVDEIHKTMEVQENEYNLGPKYQAEVPAWTGQASDSDSKWLGTRMWPPPEEHDGKHEKGGTVAVGLGRQSSCECLFPGSAECVRFHVAENRLKVKIELDNLFYQWKFNQMGEEVSLSWEPEEEKIFKSLVMKARQDLSQSNKSRHEIMNKFWKKAANLLPGKSKQNVVSYYFNVFVLRRRSYQNRVTPRTIDSDNDEEEVGSVGDRFGYERIHGLSLECSENMQRRDLEP